MSIPEIDGMTFENMFKKGSTSILSVLKGWLYQLIDGIQVKKI